MIFKSYIIEQNIQMVFDKKLFLIYGENQGLKNDIKNLDAVLPANHPKKELANKKTKFECKILNVKEPQEKKNWW